MCTLSYIPIGESDFFFTTNRDESPKRVAHFPSRYEMNESSAIFPKDVEASGTWMMCHENRFSICLLNGAFKWHKHQPPYRKSRGVVVLELTEYISVIDFVRQYNFDNIEPFTIIVLRYDGVRILEEIRWDGDSIHYRNLDANLPRIWSSSTLYDDVAGVRRETWFNAWLDSQKEFSKESILDFHKTAGKEDQFNALVMNRKDIVKTLSITQIRKDKSQTSMYYEDLQKGEFNEISI